MYPLWTTILFGTFLFLPLARAEDKPTSHEPPPDNRVMSIYLSQDFINEQIALHSKSPLIKAMKIELDTDKKQIFLRGVVQIPVEELRAINLDPKLGSFSFQVTIKPSITKHGHLVLDFPLSETYFYPEHSKDKMHERVIVPVQLLSLALASARGYLAALSGDFSSFERRAAKLEALMKSLDRSIALEKNPDAKEELKTEREGLRLQIEAIPIERKQLQTASKEVEGILGFTGEKELNFNQELAAKNNALVLKIKVSQLAPFLNGVELGGIRIIHDKKDGGGENYFAVDVNSDLASPLPPRSTAAPATRPEMKVAPAMIMRLNQSLFESDAVMSAEKKEMPSNLKNLTFNLSDDGLHIEGDWKTFLFISIHFDTVVDFVTTDVDQFEVRVRDVKVAGIDMEFLSKFILESMKKKLDSALKGICKFKYVGEEKDHSRALQVTVSPADLVPAFPNLHLVAVDVRDREFLLKIGHVDEPSAQVAPSPKPKK